MSASINVRSLKPETLHPETRLVHAGTLRSQFGETSEAMFLTQGFVYDQRQTGNNARPASSARSPAISIRGSPIRP